ncbi:MAG: nickel pincer cofactor biosynthesis protein LarC [Deltaproteobacteria bacterium]|nr:nickel pincer cofactor biosynthesis protein LarC [Deltaproteobacteria bacterium]
MKRAYLDCFSGVSGDMFLGALIDAGLIFEELERVIRSLPFDGYTIEATRSMKNGLSATRFNVIQEHKEHEHRGLTHIKEIIQSGDLSRDVKEQSIYVFEAIAREEGKIHNKSPDEIHFHEVGAVDSIIDIVGVVFAIEALGIKSISASRIPLGSGLINSGHGIIPVPAPATVALLRGVPVYDSGLEFEMVTPTGAALVSAIADSFGTLPPMIIEAVGYGAGMRDLPDRPNLLRVIIGESAQDKHTDTVAIIEANLDDTNPEWVGFLMDRLFDGGALDVVFCPIQMKKNRPGIQIQVIVNPDNLDALMEIIFSETTTIGARFRYCQRRTLERSLVEIESPWGIMQVKKVIKTDGSSSLMPEYEACRRIAEEQDIPLKDIYGWINVNIK